MPVVIASESEAVENIMGLVSTYCQPVLTAIYQPNNVYSLRLWYISLPAAGFPNTVAEIPSTTMREFMNSARQQRGKLFRIRSWAEPALAYEIPLDVRTDHD